MPKVMSGFFNEIWGKCRLWTREKDYEFLEKIQNIF